MKNKPKILSKDKFRLTWILLAIFIISNIYFAIQTSTSGAQLSYLEEEAERIMIENQKLVSQIIDLNSLKRIEEGVNERGFVKPQEIIYVTSDAVVAKVP